MKRIRMFKEVGKTWNPVVGCQHKCVYCWARRLVATRLRHIYGNFEPRIRSNQLTRIPGRNNLVFVCDMGDLFGQWVPVDWIIDVIKNIYLIEKIKHRNNTYLFLTKNPRRYWNFKHDLALFNSIVGATIETNRDTALYSKAPTTISRYHAMLKLPLKKMISIEPIMDFDLATLVKWIQNIKPFFVYVGYDNYDHHLPEPSLEKTEKLIEELRRFSEVRLKTLRKAWWE